MDLSEKVCYCSDVTAGDIKEAVERGARTLEDIKQMTGACTHCGGCETKIKVLLTYFTA